MQHKYVLTIRRKYYWSYKYTLTDYWDDHWEELLHSNSLEKVKIILNLYGLKISHLKAKGDPGSWKEYFLKSL